MIFDKYKTQKNFNSNRFINNFDGKLLAEYNGLGELMREYIYVGDRLLAEYQPQSNQLYYYTTDQVNSVRVVTNQTGVRVFAAAYDPYGGIQKIWENSYSPELKFSGKERDSESNLDYFGARYYANYYYRWLSPDPVVPLDVAYTNPQAWNLYSFNRDNPVNLIDPSGLYVFDNGTPAQQKAFNEALRRAGLIKGLEAVASVYGSLGEKNGVVIKFDKEIEEPYTGSILLQDLSSLSEVHLPLDLSDDELVIVVAHEGSHIADYKNYAKALLESYLNSGDLSGAGVIGNDAIDLTKYAAEVKAYNYSVIAAKGIGWRSLQYGIYKIMRNGMMDKNALNAFLSARYGISSKSPGKRLSGWF